MDARTVNGKRPLNYPLLPTSYLQLHPRPFLTLGPTQALWCGFNTDLGLWGQRVEGQRSEV